MDQLENAQSDKLNNINIGAMIKLGIAGMIIGPFVAFFTVLAFSWIAFWIVSLGFVILLAVLGARSKKSNSNININFKLKNIHQEEQILIKWSVGPKHWLRKIKFIQRFFTPLLIIFFFLYFMFLADIDFTAANFSRQFKLSLFSGSLIFYLVMIFFVLPWIVKRKPATDFEILATGLVKRYRKREKFYSWNEFANYSPKVSWVFSYTTNDTPYKEKYSPIPAPFSFMFFHQPFLKRHRTYAQKTGVVYYLYKKSSWFSCFRPISIWTTPENQLTVGRFLDKVIECSRAKISKNKNS